jgi:hypothetical protein
MRRSWSIWALWALGLAAVAIQALALTGFYFQPSLDSDYLYPHLFAADVLDGRYPLAGWTLGPAPYFFPDSFAYLLLLLMVGPGGLAYAAYVAAYYVLLACALGWATARARPGWNMGAWLAGVALVNALLVWWPVADHARYLWWLGTPGFHGGAVLLGLIQFSLWAGAVGTRPSRLRCVIACGLLAAGLLSDLLLFIQFVGPLTLALAWQARGAWREALRLRALLAVLVVAGGMAAAVRLCLALAGVFHFPRVVHHAHGLKPVLESGTRMLQDLTRSIAPARGAFVGLAIVGVAWAAWRLRSTCRSGGELTLLDRWIALSLIATSAMPVLSTYWTDVQSARYVLPWLVLPGWWGCMHLIAWAEPHWVRLRSTARVASGGLLGAAFLALMACNAAALAPKRWVWPAPANVVELVSGLRSRGQVRGLSDYSNAHYVTLLSGGVPRLTQVYPDGRARFGNGNAYWHFDADADRRLRSPRYTFVVMSRLDAASIAGKFGEPRQRLLLGGEEVWLYDDAGATALTGRIETEVCARVQGMRGAERLQGRWCRSR